MTASSSKVWINQSLLRDGRGYEGYGGLGIDARPGACLFLSRSLVEGGRGGSHVGIEPWDIYGYPSSAAIEVTASQLVLACGPGNRVQGGEGSYLTDTALVLTYSALFTVSN